MLKNSSRLAVCDPKSPSNKVDFVSVNCHRKAYFVDALRTVTNPTWLAGRERSTAVSEVALFFWMIIFERKICVIAGTRTTDLQFSVLAP